MSRPGWLGRILADLSQHLSSCDFEIRHSPESGTEIRGRIAKARFGEIDEFFRRDLKADHPVRVRGRWGKGDALHLRFVGIDAEADRQRARNFLGHLLR